MVRPDSIKMVTAGTLPGGEEWTTSFSLGLADGPYAGLDLAGLCNATMEAWSDFQAVYGWMSGGVSIDQVRGYVYGGGELVEQRISNLPSFDGTASTTLPNQCAVVLSLLTDRPGRRYRGRMYLPVLTATPDSNGRLLPAVTQGLANAATAFFEQVNASLPLALRPTLRLSVVSEVGEGARTEVLAVRVGNVIDTQRRRREGLAETYAESGIDYAGV